MVCSHLYASNRLLAYKPMYFNQREMVLIVVLLRLLASYHIAHIIRRSSLIVRKCSSTRLFIRQSECFFLLSQKILLICYDSIYTTDVFLTVLCLCLPSIIEIRSAILRNRQIYFLSNVTVCNYKYENNAVALTFCAFLENADFHILIVS